MIYLYCDENQYSLSNTLFPHSFMDYLSEAEIRDFHKRYQSFVNEEKKAGRL